MYTCSKLKISKMPEVNDTVELKRGAEPIKKGTSFLKYPSKLVDLKELAKESGERSEEVLECFKNLFFPYIIGGEGLNYPDVEDPYFLSIKVKGAQAQLIASACSDCKNVELVEEKRNMHVMALEDLNPGDKLFLSYGSNYWRNATDVKDPVCAVCKKPL